MNTASIKEVLYISYDGLTDPLGQSQILPYLQGLTQHGYRFTILSFEKEKRYATEGPLIHSICKEAGIDWQPLKFTQSPPVLSKIYDRWQMDKAVKRLHKLKKFDMIHCRSYIAAEMGLKMKRKYGVRFFFDMRGFWADEKVDGGQWDLKNPFFKKVYQHYKKKEKEFLQEADAIVSLTEAAKQDMLKMPGLQDLDISVIPCCADLDLFDYQKVQAEAKEKMAEELNIPADARVISYLGSIGGWYMTKEMFAFFKQLLEKDPAFIMLLLTKDDPQRVKDEAAACGIPSESLRIRFAPRAVLPTILSLSNASLFFIRPTYSKMASSPTKHAELMGMGIPVICNDLGDTGRIMQQTNTGAVVESFDEKGYSAVINRIDEVLQISPNHIRASAFQYFDLKKGVDSYLSLYQKLLPL